jgi:CXXX repeat peptide maturase
MYQYLLVILEKGAVPFCHYSNPYYHALGTPVLMPLAQLEEIIRYTLGNNLSINFLYGRHRLPLEYESLIETINHVKMIPLCLHDIYPDGILVLDASDCKSFSEIKKDSSRNLILRVEPFDLAQLSLFVEAMEGGFKRLNIHLVGIENFSEKDLDLYKNQLQKISAMLQRHYHEGTETEINVMTDRLLLKQMNNCDAGIKHLTIAPNGKGYICPGFYHDDEENTLGVWTQGQEISSVNQQLLSIQCAPICSRCDAFHCKRCIYLNQRTTLEINVPSKEQCLVAHLEREVSRKMLNKLRDIKPFDGLPVIPCLSYQDPFDIVAQPIDGEVTAAVDRTIGSDMITSLDQIYEMQKQILRKLEAK